MAVDATEQVVQTQAPAPSGNGAAPTEAAPAPAEAEAPVETPAGPAEKPDLSDLVKRLDDVPDDALPELGKHPRLRPLLEAEREKVRSERFRDAEERIANRVLEAQRQAAVSGQAQSYLQEIWNGLDDQGKQKLQVVLQANQQKTQADALQQNMGQWWSTIKGGMSRTALFKGLSAADWQDIEKAPSEEAMGQILEEKLGREVKKIVDKETKRAREAAETSVKAQARGGAARPDNTPAAGTSGTEYGSIDDAEAAFVRNEITPAEMRAYRRRYGG